jgi:putative FmdB family regulatory protein
MPIYEYKCPECGRVFEVTRPFAVTSPPECPTCGCQKTNKQISVPAKGIVK